MKDYKVRKKCRCVHYSCNICNPDKTSTRKMKKRKRQEVKREIEKEIEKRES